MFTFVQVWDGNHAFFFFVLSTFVYTLCFLLLIGGRIQFHDYAHNCCMGIFVDGIMMRMALFGGKKREISSKLPWKTTLCSQFQIGKCGVSTVGFPS